MITFPEAVRDAVRSVQCALLADNEYVVGSVGRFAGPTRERALDGINATRRLLGCPMGDDPLPPPPDFTGGQCSNVLYTVNVSYTGSNNQVQTTLTQSFRGPVRGLFPRPPNEFNSVAVFLESGLATQAPVQMFNTSPANANSGQITSIIRQGGLPDDCGNPDPTYPPPISRPTNIDVTYNIDNGDEVNLTIPFIFAPIEANFNGTLRIPFTFDFGGFEFTGNFNFDPNVEITINPPRVPSGSDDGLEDLPAGDPEEEVPELEPDRKIIGVVVTSSLVGEQQLTTILLDGMPNIFAPRAGSIKFAYSLGVTTFWSNDIDVKGDRIFIPCPFSQGADAVVVSPAPGVQLEWIPIRGFPLATVNDV